MAVAAQRRELVLSGYRQLLRLIYRLPDASQRHSGLQEAARTLRERRTCDDAEKHLAHLKELAARTAFLRVITPRRPSDAAQATGRFVLREGKLVEGAGEAPGSRCEHAATHDDGWLGQRV